MPKVSDENLVRVHVMLFSEDVDRIRTMFGSARFSSFIRTIVRATLKKLDTGTVTVDLMELADDS